MAQALTLDQIREKGMKALSKELTPIEIARFFQMFEKGEGNYTLERKKIYKNKSVDAIYKDVLTFRKQSGKKTSDSKTSKKKRTAA